MKPLHEILEAMNFCEGDDGGFVFDNCPYYGCPYYEHDYCQKDLRNDLIARLEEYKKVRESWERMHDDFKKIIRRTKK